MTDKLTTLSKSTIVRTSIGTVIAVALAIIGATQLYDNLANRVSALEHSDLSANQLLQQIRDQQITDSNRLIRLETLIKGE